MAVQYLIDGTGRIWDPYDSRLLAELGDPDPDYDIVSFAVRNLGHVAVNVLDQPERKVIISIRLMTVHSAALAATVRLLADLPQHRVEIRAEQEGANTYTFGNSATALQWLAAEGTSIAAHTSFTDVAVQARSLNLLADRRLNNISQSEDKLALLFKKWRISSQQYSPAVTDTLVRFGLLDRMSIAVERSNDNALVFEHLGTKLNMYDRYEGEGWNYHFVGRQVADQPDRNYGKYVDNTLRAVITSGKPTFDHVDAMIRHRTGAHRTRYDRLILPWKGLDGATIVTSLSYKTEADSADAPGAPS